MPPLEDYPILSRFWTSAMLAAALGLIWLNTTPTVTLAAIAICGALYLSGLVTQRRLQALARSRHKDDIGTFALAFDRRSVDPFVIRAVYEGLQRMMGKPFPLKPDDDLLNTLELDDEDLDIEIDDMAERCGRDMSDPETNPLWGKIETAADLVHFLNTLPKIAQPA